MKVKKWHGISLDRSTEGKIGHKDLGRLIWGLYFTKTSGYGRFVRHLLKRLYDMRNVTPYSERLTDRGAISYFGGFTPSNNPPPGTAEINPQFPEMRQLHRRGQIRSDISRLSFRQPTPVGAIRIDELMGRGGVWAGAHQKKIGPIADQVHLYLRVRNSRGRAHRSRYRAET